jgi:hypothetical protein
MYATKGRRGLPPRWPKEAVLLINVINDLHFKNADSLLEQALACHID